MKNIYEAPEMQVVYFESKEEITLLSSAIGGDGNDNEISGNLWN